jgi:hypothetical protein
MTVPTSLLLFDGAATDRLSRPREVRDTTHMLPSSAFAILVATASATAGTGAEPPNLCVAIADKTVSATAFDEMLADADLEQRCTTTGSGSRLTVGDAIGLGAITMIAPPLGLAGFRKRSGSSKQTHTLAGLALRVYRADRAIALIEAGAPEPAWTLSWAAHQGELELAALAHARGQRLHSLSFSDRVDAGQVATALLDLGVELPCELYREQEWTPALGAALDRAELPAACQLALTRTLPQDVFDANVARALSERTPPTPTVIWLMHERAVRHGDRELSRQVGDRWGGPCRPEPVELALELGDVDFADALLARWGLPARCWDRREAEEQVQQAALLSGPAGLALLEAHDLMPDKRAYLFSKTVLRSRALALFGPWDGPRPYGQGDPLETLLHIPEVGAEDDDRIAWLLADGATDAQRATLLRMRMPSPEAVEDLAGRWPDRALTLLERGVPASPGVVAAAVENKRPDLIRAAMGAGVLVEADDWHAWTCTWPDARAWVASEAPLSDTPCPDTGRSELLVDAALHPETLQQLQARGLDPGGPMGVAAMEDAATAVLDRGRRWGRIFPEDVQPLLDAHAVGLAASPAFAEVLATTCRTEVLATLPAHALTANEWEALNAVVRDRSWSCRRAVKTVAKAKGTAHGPE